MRPVSLTQTSDAAQRTISSEPVRQYEYRCGPLTADEFKRFSWAVASELLKRAREAGGDETIVYFVQSGHGPVKIGIAKDPAGRRRELQVGNHTKLRLIGALRAPRVLERMLHRHFAADRLEGEWFKPNPMLLHIAELYRTVALGGRRQLTWDDLETWKELQDAGSAA